MWENIPGRENNRAKSRKGHVKVEQKESQCDASVVYEGNEKWKNNI